MDLKRITKDKLYEMLCEERERVKELEAIVEKQAANEASRTAYILRADEQCAQLRKERDDFAVVAGDRGLEIEELERQVKELRVDLEDAKEDAAEWRSAYYECVKHPWRNLLRRLVK